MDEPASPVNEKVPATANPHLRLSPAAGRVLELAVAEAALAVKGLVLAMLQRPVAGLREHVTDMFKAAERTYADAVGRERIAGRTFRGR
jgi:hypothetical protein